MPNKPTKRQSQSSRSHLSPRSELEHIERNTLESSSSWVKKAWVRLGGNAVGMTGADKPRA